MMLRTTSQPRNLAVTESRDSGATWSEPSVTDYTDSGCRFHFGRLPDGRFFGLSCPEPKSRRTPLILATSEDGVVFDRQYILGNEPADPARESGGTALAHGRYGYPHAHICGDTMYVIYSVCKEDIWVCRFPLSELK